MPYVGRFSIAQLEEPATESEVITRLPYTQYDRHYKRVGNVPLDYPTVKANPDKYRIYGEWLPKEPTAAILDIGCGWGNLLLCLWATGYRNLTAVDVSEAMCAIARANLPSEISVNCADATAFLETRQRTYDLITIFDMIEHVSVDMARTLLELCRDALAPGGSVVIRTPNMANLLSAYSMYIDITHVQGYTEYSLFQLLDLARFVNHRMVQLRFFESRQGLSRLFGGLSKRDLMNAIVHRMFFALRGQLPVPTSFDYNITVQSFKP